MKVITILCLLMTCPVLMSGQSTAAKVKSDSATVEQTLMQLERDWMQAIHKKDAAALDKILADDWAALDHLGKSVSKVQMLADLKSGALAVQSTEQAPMKARVFGDAAVVTGGHTEKSTYHGKDSSGKYVWTDVFVNRNGRWQAVASQWTNIGK